VSVLEKILGFHVLGPSFGAVSFLRSNLLPVGSAKSTHALARPPKKKIRQDIQIHPRELAKFEIPPTLIKVVIPPGRVHVPVKVDPARSIRGVCEDVFDLDRIPGMFGSFWICQRCSLGLVFEPHVASSDELDSAFSWQGAVLLQDRSDAVFIRNWCDICRFDGDIRGGGSKTIAWGVDEFTNCLERVEMDVGDVRELEVRREEFSVSSRGDIGNVPISRVGVALVDFDPFCIPFLRLDVSPRFLALGFASDLDLDRLSNTHRSRLIFIPGRVDQDVPVAIAPGRARVLLEQRPSGKRLGIVEIQLGTWTGRRRSSNHQPGRRIIARVRKGVDEPQSEESRYQDMA